MRFSVLALAASALLFTRSAPAADCTRDLAAEGIRILQGIEDASGGDGGYPALPSDIVTSGPNAAVPYIESLDAAQLDLLDRNSVAAGHWVDGLRLALAGQCGAPLSAAERAQASRLVDDFAPWVGAWRTAVPVERARRASDGAAAAGLCEAIPALDEAKRALAFEQSNPSGVVDLRALYVDGQRVQALTVAISARKRLFRRDRGKGFAVGMCRGPRI